MKTLGKFITQGLWQASLCALIFAVLPLCSWLAIVIVALISLRKGPQQGFVVLLWACLPGIALAVAGWHGSGIQVGYFSATCVVVWLMALLLVKTSWAMMLQIIAVIGIVAVVCLHGFYPELVTQMQQYLHGVLSQTSIAVTQQQHYITAVSQGVVRMLVVSISMFSCLWLLLARWWQAVLFNPGKLQSELHNIRLNNIAAGIVVVLLALLLITKATWLMDIVPVALLPFTIAGLSIVHSYATAKKLNVAWLVGFYIVLIVLMGIVSSFLAMLAVSDSWFNLRCFWQQKTRG